LRAAGPGSLHDSTVASERHLLQRQKCVEAGLFDAPVGSLIAIHPSALRTPTLSQRSLALLHRLSRSHRDRAETTRESSRKPLATAVRPAPVPLRSRRPGTESSQTRRWREVDSNFRFRVRCKRGLRRKSPAAAACRRRLSAAAVGGHQLRRKAKSRNRTVIARGTGSSNPSPSSGESAANRDRGNHREQHLGNATLAVGLMVMAQRCGRRSTVGFIAGRQRQPERSHAVRMQSGRGSSR
jgi:hypothetical protein